MSSLRLPGAVIVMRQVGPLDSACRLFDQAMASTVDMGGQSKNDWIQPVLAFDLEGSENRIPAVRETLVLVDRFGWGVIPSVISR
jgi:hypothetical protein